MTPIIDARSLASLRQAQEDDAPDIIGETVAIFLADSALQLDLVRRAVAEDDADTIHRMAYAIRAGARVLGAARLADTCALLEIIGAERRLDEAAEVVERIVFELALAQQTLRRIARSS